MSMILSLIRRFKKVISLSLITLIISILVSMYFGIYYERKPNISLVVLNNTNVLDVHEPVRDLSISFQGEDIQKEGLNLRILKAKLVNDGGVDILQSYYDRNDTWGIRVDGGEIIEARLLESNSEYIKANLNPIVIKDEGLIQLAKLIFERGDFFILEILVLHEMQEMPKVIPVGKVAGIEGIRVSEIESDSKETNFVKQVFSGSPLVQATRSFSYFVVFVGIAVTVLFLLLILSELNNTRKRNSKKREFWGLVRKMGIEKEAKERYPGQLEVLSDIYAIRGIHSLAVAKHSIERGDRIREWLQRRKPLEGLSPLGEMKRQKEIDAMQRAARIFAIDEELEDRDIAIELVDKGIVNEGKDKELVVDKDFKKLLDGLVKDSEK